MHKYKHVSYDKAKAFAVSLNLPNRKHWRAYINGELPDLPTLPSEMSGHPDGLYIRKGSWLGWADFLGKPHRPPRIKSSELPEAVLYELARGLYTKKAIAKKFNIDVKRLK
jgi:hypothetical protein